jgi:hypothetical protein
MSVGSKYLLSYLDLSVVFAGAGKTIEYSESHIQKGETDVLNTALHKKEKRLSRIYL